MSLKRVREAIRKNKSFLVTSHVNLEGDAIGSELALAHLLKLKGKYVVAVNDDKIPAEYSFLPGQRYLRDFKDIRQMKRSFDVAILLDCSTLERVGVVRDVLKRSKVVVNIDHHISNNKFGDINWVDPHASSTSEMIFKLYKAEGCAFDETSALLLYVGILTDTGSFRYSNTSSLCHRMAAELLKFGINAQRVYSLLYEMNSYSDMMALAEMLIRLKRDNTGRIIWVKLRKEFLRRKIEIDISEHILNFARSIRGVEVALIFKENLGDTNEVRVNLRSAGRVDVSEIAAFLGGGGHKTAAGCTVSGSIDSVEKKVLRIVRKAVRSL